MNRYENIPAEANANITTPTATTTIAELPRLLRQVDPGMRSHSRIPKDEFDNHDADQGNYEPTTRRAHEARPRSTARPHLKWLSTWLSRNIGGISKSATKVANTN
jgi:hypothetical protein